MNTTLWIFQGLMAFVFLFSGMNKAYFNEKTLIQKGQTGVEGLPAWFIKFIGISEMIGAIALITPMLMNKWIMLTPIAAICLGLIMVPAAYIHFKRKESKNVMINILILITCVLIAYFRMN